MKLLHWLKRKRKAYIDRRTESELRDENDRLHDEVGRLTESLEKEQVKNRIQELEIEKLAAVCARDLARVQAETEMKS